jgi:SAM-dependent methyltransferase
VSRPELATDAALRAGRGGSRAALRTAVVWELLRAALSGGPYDVLDAGGGTGGFAVPLAELGHRVTVVDPSPDSLAALERRAAEAGVAPSIRAVQGDAAGLLDVAGSASVDVVLCHSVLEVVDDPAAALAGVAAVLRPGGRASVLAATRGAAVVGRAIAGRFDEARRALDDPHGRFADTDILARRFTETELQSLLDGAGFTVETVHGVRVFADLVPGALLDAEPHALAALLALEERVADLPEWRSLATQLHILAVRS